MSRVRLIMLSMLAVFAISAVASASASASSDEWRVCEEGTGTGIKYTEHKCTVESGTGKWEWKILAAGETRKVKSAGGTFTLTALGKTITCAAVADKGTITGGKPGKDLAETITFTGCTTKQAGCSVKTAGQVNGTIVVTNIPTKLEQRKNAKGEEVVVDNFEQKEEPVGSEKFQFVTLKFEGTCSEYPETKVKGTVAAEVVKGTGELNFPSPGLEKDTLEAFGVGATLTGKDTQELENEWAVTAI